MNCHSTSESCEKNTALVENLRETPQQVRYAHALMGKWRGFDDDRRADLQRDVRVNSFTEYRFMPFVNESVGYDHFKRDIARAMQPEDLGMVDAWKAEHENNCRV